MSAKKKETNVGKNIWTKSMAGALEKILVATMEGNGDSDRHLLPVFSLAVASKAKTMVELGVRGGSTTLPLLLAAAANGGMLISVDKQKTDFKCPPALRKHWRFVKSDALQFLKTWDTAKKMDFVYVDDWHSYDHVKKELAYIDRFVGPSSIILLHDLMSGNTQPFYHADLTLKTGQWANGGPYRAVAELNQQIWEWATVPWNNGLTLLRKKYSSKFHHQ